MKSSHLLLVAGALAVAVGPAGCASAPFAAELESGKFEGLGAKVSAEVDAGRFGRDDAVAFARAVAEQTIEGAKSPNGRRRVREVAPCARELTSALKARAGTTDDVGAEAALVLVDAGLAEPSSYGGDDGAPAWRAVATRALVYPEDGEERRTRMLDPDERVRLEAVRAAAAAHDPADAEPLLEAARVDPLEAVRTGAALAAGTIGGDRIVLGLKDLWPLTDAPTRDAIARAWAAPNSLATGGRRELAWAVGADRGPSGVAASIALARARGAGSGEAEAALERTIGSAATADRVRAIRAAPLEVAPIRSAVERASADPDKFVAAVALGRRLEYAEGARRTALVAKLLVLADGASEAALAAQMGLARAGAQPVGPLLARATHSPSRAAREVAGVGLAVLGDLPHAAAVAADSDPHTRTVVACAILRAAR